jgi:hypothetical protein
MAGSLAQPNLWYAHAVMASMALGCRTGVREGDPAQGELPSVMDSVSIKRLHNG